MSSRTLLVEIELLDARYHGVGDWPPSPFRVFQALVAGAYGGQWRVEPSEGKDAAFRWLERLSAPLVSGPQSTRGRATTYFVPNNDADTVGGDPINLPKIRTAKVLRPVLLEPPAVVRYAWRFEEGEEHARLMCELAERLHALGRGIDPAFARAQILDAVTLGDRLSGLGAVVARPAEDSTAPDGRRCPTAGSLDSLFARHHARSLRIQVHGRGKAASTLFRQPPKARSRIVPYDSPPARLLFDLRPSDGRRPFASIDQAQAVAVATAVRNVVERRLSQAQESRRPMIERYVVGRGANADDVVKRVRIVPLPSIGSPNTDASIRRVLIEVPPGCPVASSDVAWAVSGQTLPEFDRVDRSIGEVREVTLVPAADDGMLRHYGIGRRTARTWRSVTPVSLPLRVAGPPRSGGDRVAEEAAFGHAIRNALRHAGLDPHGVDVRVQVEPFHPKGLPARAFASGRFTARTLRHVAITFPDPVTGPVVIGDGRWLGLGIMAPAPCVVPDVHVFAVDAPGLSIEDSLPALRAVRRAVLARAADLGRPDEALPMFFTGHDENGAPAASGHHEHLFFVADDEDGNGRIDRIAIVAPHRVDRAASQETKLLRHLRNALDGLAVVRAGRIGVLRLTANGAPSKTDALFGYGRVWESRTPYRPTRHPRGPAEIRLAIARDLITESRRRGLPMPVVELLDVVVGPRGGVAARARLTFARRIKGPILLGAGSHFGAGVFASADSRATLSARR